MTLTAGLFDRMVLQRDRRGRSRAAFAGECAAAGAVIARVTRAGRAVHGFAARRVGRAAGGRFAGMLAGLPAGGPYDVELCVAGGAERLRVCDVLVGDVWILAGQSNMEGIGWRRDALKPDPLVRAGYMDDRWDVAQDPVHNIGRAVDEVHRLIRGGQLPVRAPHVGVGPAMGFGQEMLRRTGVPQGLLPCAHGGTSMAQWDPARRDEGTRSLYGATVRRFRKYGARVAGVLWYQGESDANPADCDRYVDRMKRLVRAMRRDFGDPRLPFAMVQIGCVVGERDARPWNRIQDLQLRLQDTIPGGAVVPAVDLPLDDGVHISGAGQNRLGRRLAQAMDVLRAGRRAGRLPLVLGRIEVHVDPPTGLGNVHVRFRNVMGALQAPAVPAGFSLVTPGPADLIVAVELRGDTAVLRTTQREEDLRRLYVQYGQGAHPVCNVVDAADRAVPAFGPVSLGEPQAVTPFVRRLDVSAAQPSAGRLESVEYPADPGPLGFATREFSGTFCDLHADLFACAPEDRLVWFRHRIRCPEAMRLVVELGYDGPVRLWLDGKLAYRDPDGVNPARPDDARVRFAAPAGEHEVLVALGSNFGKAWGLYLRYRRLGVPRRKLAQGVLAYGMPESA